MSPLFRSTLTTLCFAALVTSVSANDVKHIADFTLPSHRAGAEWSLSDVGDAKAVVVAFLGTECPMVKLYGPRLEKLQAKYKSQGVDFVGINSNSQDSLSEITRFVADYSITYPMLKDPGNVVADQFSASRTPEVFLLDQNRVVRYQGRIDDQNDPGILRAAAQSNFLADAIDEVLAGNAVTTPRTKAVGCYIGRSKKTKPRGDITWSNDIAAIFNAKCVECHRVKQIAPFTLTSYEDVLGWQETILEVIDNGRMPPWNADDTHSHSGFKNDPRLSADQKKKIHAWVANGMPEGDPADLPEPPKFADGWRMPEEPDQIIAWRDVEKKGPFTVPADGVVEYMYEVVDPGWTEDQYVVAAEARPDKVEVVHHIIAYVIPPGEDPRKPKNRRMLVGYAPGSIPNILGDGIAMRVRAGSKLLFEMHYTPNGVAQEDLSYIGLKFEKKENVSKLLRGGAILDTEFEIPGQAPNYQVPEQLQETGKFVYTARRHEKLLDLTPHMHLRGKAFKFEIWKSNEKVWKPILHVPQYDFNWQLTYELKDPEHLKPGDRIRCTAWYDNSASNPFLTDEQRNVRVHWGDQSWEEMMIGFFTVVDADPVAATDDAGE